MLDNGYIRLYNVPTLTKQRGTTNENSKSNILNEIKR